jgi:hypothetical protein
VTRTSLPFPIPILPACALLAACAPFAWRLDPSVIERPQANVPALQVPDSVTTGAPVTVTVWTKSGGCTRRGRTEVTTHDRVATIRLFDSVLVRSPDDYACPSVLRFARNVFSVQFSHSGPAIVRVIGTDTLERAVVIR